MGLTRPRAYQIFDIDYKQSVRVVTVSNVTLSGGAPSSVDGVTLSLNDRVLVTGQSTGSQNGLYYVTTVGTGSNGTWARSIDGNETGEIDAGMIVMVTEGTTYADTQWKLTTNDPIVIGTTALTFVLNVQANSISSGTSNVVVNSNANVTVSSAGTANVFTVSSTGTVTSGTASVTGNITGGNLNTGAQVVATGNITGGNLNTGAQVVATGNITGGNLNTAGVVRSTGIVYGLELTSTNSSGSEGGQINLAQPASGSTLAGGITIDAYNNLLRFFEQGGTARGAYIDLSACSAGVGTNLLSGGGGGTPGGSNTYVQFNDGGAFGGNAQFTYDKVTNSLTVGNVSTTSNGAGTNLKVGDDAWIGDVNQTNTIQITGQQNATDGYIIFGNSNTNKLGRSGTGPLTYDGAFSATGNITGGNVLGGANVNATTHTGTTVSVTANITGGNILTGGIISATGNVSGGNVAAATAIFSLGTVGASGNTSGGNLTTAGQVVATGNITGGNINTAGKIVSTLATGTAPFTVSSTTLVTNLNADLLDGLNSASTNTVSTIVARDASGNFAAGTITATLSGAATTAGTVTTAAQPNITSVGTLSSLSVTGNVTAGGHVGTIYTNSIINTGANATGNIGSSTLYFNTAFVKATSAQYADLAEMYQADANYAPGTVVEFGGDYEITQTTQSCSTAVAGIISTNPSYLMNSCQPGEYVLPVALTGRVPCRVQGPVKKGDVLISSNVPGVAQRIGANWQPGCTVGKAMEAITDTEIKTIEVAVGRL